MQPFPIMIELEGATGLILVVPSNENCKDISRVKQHGCEIKRQKNVEGSWRR